MACLPTGPLPPSRLLKKFLVRAIFAMFASATGGSSVVEQRYKWRSWYVFASFSALQTESSRDSQDLRDANQVVSRGSGDEEPFNQISPAVSVLRKPPTVFIQPNFPRSASA